VDTLATGIGESGEQLLSLAYDDPANITYIGTNLGNVFQRDGDGVVTLLASISPNPLLGLEVAPDTFGGFGGHLVATTSMGEVFTVDPASPTGVLLTTIESLDPPTTARLIDLVFASDGRLFVLDNGDGPGGADPIDARVIEVAPNGAIEALDVDPLALGFPEGIAMDEGANRLLIATIKDSGPAQLIALSLGADGAGDESITAITNLVLQPGFFPTGIVYDRIGTAIVRQGAGTTAVDAFSVAP
jgi:sugar lactone lactonase YvrE